jgi:hypothetical protein
MTRYKQARNNVVSKIRDALADYHNKQLHSLSNDKFKNPKLYWKNLKTIYSTKNNTVLPPLQHNGDIITDPTQKAEIFNDFFVQQTKLDERFTALPQYHAHVH